MNPVDFENRYTLWSKSSLFCKHLYWWTGGFHGPWHNSSNEKTTNVLMQISGFAHDLAIPQNVTEVTNWSTHSWSWSCIFLHSCVQFFGNQSNMEVKNWTNLDWKAEWYPSCTTMSCLIWDGGNTEMEARKSTSKVRCPGMDFLTHSQGTWVKWVLFPPCSVGSIIIIYQVYVIISKHYQPLLTIINHY